MSELPRVALVLLTYDGHEEGIARADTAERTLRAALDRIQYPEPIDVHIADDGSHVEHRELLRLLAGGYESVGSVGVTNAERRGYGASFNLSTQAVHDSHDAVLVLEDDWELSRPLDLLPLVHALRDDIQCIRLGYVGFTQELSGTFLHTPAGIMVLLDSESAEPHVAAGHARIETVDYQRAIGPWPEGLPAGQTEVEWVGRAPARDGVAWPLDYGPASQTGESLFAHIGAADLGEIVPGAAA